MQRQAPRHIKQILGENIKAARTAAGLTQLDLGRAVADSDGTLVWRWEKGIVRPSDANMQALADILGKPVGWFYTDHIEAAA